MYYLQALIFTLVLLVKLCISKFESSHRYDEDCVLDEKTEKIQVAFVVDNTWNNHQFVDKLKFTTEKIMNRLNTLHKGTECAMALHANWLQSAFGPRHDLAEACYDVYIPFTDDVRKFSTQVKAVRYLYESTAPDGAPEKNGVSALAFCAADKNIGWAYGPDKHGRRVHHFMVMVTGEWSLFSLPVPGNRTAFRGDGSDTCATSLPASLQDLGRVLDKNDVYIIGAYFKKKETHVSYVNNFKDYGYDHRHCHGEKAYMESNDFEDQLSDLVYECIKTFLKCMYLDPPGYNTLGL